MDHRLAPLFLAAFTGLTLLAGSAAGATKKHASFFRPAPTQIIRMGDDSGDLVRANADLSGWDIQDIEVYRDEIGTPRYDTVWTPGSSSQLLSINQTREWLVEHMNTHSDRSLVDFSSYKSHTGEQLYVFLFEQSAWTQKHEFHLTQSEWIAALNFHQQAGFGLWTFETFLDDRGQRRYDSVFMPTTRPAKLEVGVTVSQLGPVVNGLAQQGFLIWSFEHYRDLDGTERYDLYFRQEIGANVLYIDHSEAQLLATWQALQGVGLGIVELEVLHIGRTPSWNHYGTGLPGKIGVPGLALTKPPVLGVQNALQIESSTDQPTVCVVFWSNQEADYPFRGGSMLLLPTETYLFAVGPGTTIKEGFFANSMALDDRTVYLQLALSDPDAVQGISLSRGMAVNFGRLE